MGCWSRPVSSAGGSVHARELSIEYHSVTQPWYTHHPYPLPTCFLSPRRFECDFAGPQAAGVSTLQLRLFFSQSSDVAYVNTSIANAPFWSTLMGTLNVSFLMGMGTL